MERVVGEEECISCQEWMNTSWITERRISFHHPWTSFFDVFPSSLFFLSLSLFHSKGFCRSFSGRILFQWERGRWKKKLSIIKREREREGRKRIRKKHAGRQEEKENSLNQHPLIYRFRLFLPFFFDCANVTQLVTVLSFAPSFFPVGSASRSSYNLQFDTVVNEPLGSESAKDVQKRKRVCVCERENTRKEEKEYERERRRIRKRMKEGRK